MLVLCRGKWGSEDIGTNRLHHGRLFFLPLLSTEVGKLLPAIDHLVHSACMHACRCSWDHLPTERMHTSLGHCVQRDGKHAGLMHDSSELSRLLLP